MRRTLGSLLIALSAIACGGDGAQDASDTSRDTAQVASPTVPDTAVAGEDAQPAPEVALRAAMERLLRGDTAPGAENSWFSSATAGALRSVSVDAAGHATVDFTDLRTLIPNASSSAGSALLLDELNAAVFSVDAVRSVEYLIDGSCERFWEWLQYGCQTVQRP